MGLTLLWLGKCWQREAGIRRRTLRLWILLLAVLLPPQVAGARAGSSLVVLVASDPSGPITKSLERDLEGLGLGVLVLSATPENSAGRASLERTARSFGAIAAVRLVPEGDGIEVWVVDRVTNKTVIRQLAATDGSLSAPDEIALGVIELLRASLMELHVPGAPSGEVAASATVRKLSFTKPVPPGTPYFSLGGAAAVDLGLRSVGPSLHALWTAWASLGGCFGMRAFASLPIAPERAGFAEGDVEVNATLAGIGPTCSLSGPHTRLLPRVGLGLVAARLHTEGRASAGFRSNSERVWLGGGYALLGVGLKLTSQVRLNLDLTAIALLTPAVITADERSVGTWGAPGGLASLGVEVLVGE